MINSWNIHSSFWFPIILMVSACSGIKEGGEPGLMVSADWLQDHLDDPAVVILHAGTAGFYDSIHIPGARLIIPSDFTQTAGELRNEMPPADSLLDLLREVGVNNDSKIVLYGQSARLLTRTARVFVSLDHLGLGDRTFVLDGGLPAWLAGKGELTSLDPQITPGNLEAGELKKVVIKSDELDSLRWSDKLVLIDVRSDSEYQGSRSTGDKAPEGGHIEGAYFLPYQDLLQDENPHLFKPDPELEMLFRKLGMDQRRETVVYCGSGIRASMTYLAARHLGYPVLLYDGSYEEWNMLGLPLTSPVAFPVKKD